MRTAIFVLIIIILIASQATADELSQAKTELIDEPTCECTPQADDKSCRGVGPRFLESDYTHAIEIYAIIGEELHYAVTPANNWCSVDWKDVEFDFNGLPAGAVVHFSTGANKMKEPLIIWRPNRKDLGVYHATARVRAKGYKWSEAPITITVTEQWETFFMPGVQYSLWAPEARDELGVMQGVSIQYLIAAWIHRNNNYGPSHGRVYIDLDLLRSSVLSDLGFIYSLGFSLSFERNPKRQFLIPYFGLEFGGVYQKPDDQKKIHTAQICPLGGLNLWADQNIFINVTVGYMIPFSHLEDLRGLHVKAGLNFSFW